MSVLLEGVSRIIVPKGKRIFVQGRPDKLLYLLQDGRADTDRLTSDGTKTILGLFHAPSILGQQIYSREGELPDSATAFDDCTLDVFDRRTLPRILGRKIIEEELRRAASSDLKYLKRRILNQMPNSPATKLAAALIEIGQSESAPDDLFEIEVKQQWLADYIGHKRVVVNRTMARWINAGIINVQRMHYGSRITVKDPAALTRYHLTDE